MLILLNILSTLTGQIIFLSPLDNNINARAAIAILAAIILLYIIFSIGVILTTFAFKRKKSKKELAIAIIAHSITAIAGLMYLVGDDITTILVLYSNEFECNENCRLVFQTVGRALLISAILFFRLTPAFVNKSTVVMNLVSDEHISHPSWSPWKATAQSVALIVELDAWFSAVADLPLHADTYCPVHELIVSWVLYGASLVIWAVLLLLIVTPGIIKAKGKCQENIFKIFAICGVIVVIWFCSAVLILADNTQPLGCLFNCDLHVVSTNNRTDTCNERRFYGATLSLNTLVLILLSTITVALLSHWVKKLLQPSVVIQQHDSASIKEDNFNENNGHSHEDNDEGNESNNGELHVGKNESHNDNEESQGGNEVDHKESQGGNEEYHGNTSQGNEESQGNSGDNEGSYTIT